MWDLNTYAATANSNKASHCVAAPPPAWRAMRHDRTLPPAALSIHRVTATPPPPPHSLPPPPLTAVAVTPHLLSPTPHTHCHRHPTLDTTTTPRVLPPSPLARCHCHPSPAATATPRPLPLPPHTRCHRHPSPAVAAAPSPLPPLPLTAATRRSGAERGSTAGQVRGHRRRPGSYFAGGGWRATERRREHGTRRRLRRGRPVRRRPDSSRQG